MAPLTVDSHEVSIKSHMLAPALPPPPPPAPCSEFRFARSTTVLAINDEIGRSPRHLPHHRHPSSTANDQPMSMLKRSQTQILDAKLDNESFDRDTQIRVRELKCSAMGQQLMEQLERLRLTDDADLFSIKISMFDAAVQRMEKLLNLVDI
jgi:hypothetical protein